MLRMLPHGALRRATLGAVVVLGLCVPTAEAGWGKPSVLVTGDDAALLTTAVAPDGSLRAAVSDSRRQIALGLTSSTDPAAFADPLVALRSPAIVVQVALVADGSGVALEIQRHGPSSVVAFDAAGTAQPPLVLGDVTGETVGIAPGGAAIAAWVTKTSVGPEVDAAVRDPGSATFGAPTRVGYTTDADTLVQAGIGDRGEATVAWQVNEFPSQVDAATRLAGAGFAKARVISRGATEAQLAVGPGGQAILVAPQDREVDVSVKAPGVAALPVARRLDRARDGFATAVAAGGRREVALAWMASSGPRGRARVRVYTGTAGAKAPRRVGTLGANAGGEDLGLAVDGRGATVASWEEDLQHRPGHPEARSHLGVAYRPSGGRFGPATFLGPVSLDATPEAVQIGAGGRAYVAYEAFESGDTGGASYRRVYVAERRP